MILTRPIDIDELDEEDLDKIMDEEDWEGEEE